MYFKSIAYLYSLFLSIARIQKLPTCTVLYMQQVTLKLQDTYRVISFVSKTKVKRVDSFIRLRLRANGRSNSQQYYANRFQTLRNNMQQGVQTDAKLVTSNNVASVCTGIDTYTGDYFQAFCGAKRAVIRLLVLIARCI